MYSAFNILTKAFDVILCPFGNLPPVWGVAFLALLTAVFVLYVYKRVSNQRAIKRLKKRIQGYFLGIYLFRDDLALILGSQARVFSNVMRYMGHSLLPFAVVLVPILLACVQMQLRYGYSPLQPGDTTLVSAVLEPGVRASETSIVFSVSEGLAVETPPIRVASLNEIDWRLGVKESGIHSISLNVGGSEMTMGIDAGRAARKIYPVSEKSVLLSALLYPGERPLEGPLPLRRVSVAYPHAAIGFLGFRLHWSIVYFLLAIVFGIMLKRFFKVEF